jgi:hypothetical protein
MFGFGRRRTFDVVEGTVIAPSNTGHLRVKPMPHRWASYPIFEVGRRIAAGLNLQPGELVRMRITTSGIHARVSRIERMFGDAARGR